MPTFPQPIIIGSMALIALTAIGFMSKLVQSVVNHRALTRASSEILMYLLGLLYTVGALTKFFALGPSWVRWHLADIGFPVMLLLLMTLIKQLTMVPALADAKDDTAFLKLRLEINAARFKMLTFALVISVGYEVFTGLWLVPRAKNKGMQNIPIGEFDWVDIACYVLGSVAAAAILSYQKWIDQMLLDANQTAKVIEAELVRQARNQRERDSRKAYVPSRKKKK